MNYNLPTIMRKKVEEARTVAVKDIQMIIGEHKFNDLLEKQSKYYEDYFKFEEKVEPAVEAVDEPKTEENNPKSK